MTWHRCHLFGEVFYLKPPSGPSQDPRPLCSRDPHLNPLPRGEADAAAPGEGKRTCGYNFAPDVSGSERTLHICPSFYPYKTVSVADPKTRSVMRIVLIHTSHD